MIELKNLSKVYRTDTIETIALNKINLLIPKGEFVSIMGPSGCGKSTLLNMIGLIDHPSEGIVEIDQAQVNQYKEKQLAKFRNEHLGFIFQSFHLINDLNVVDNVELPLLYRKVGASERKKRAAEALERVGLANRMKHFPNQLSGGQKQRVAIARALVGQPSILLADEPTGNLDSELGNEVMDFLLKLNEELGTTTVMVTHDENMARKTNRIIRMYDGNLVN